MKYCPACRRERHRQSVRDFQKRQRQEAQEEKAKTPFRPCADCGRLLVPTSTRRALCDDCRAAHSRRKYERREKDSTAPVPAPVKRHKDKAPVVPHRGMSLAEACRGAAQEGLSYGQYVQKYGV